MGCLKSLFCKHEFIFKFRTSGDANNFAIDMGGRDIHKCKKCGKYDFK